MNILHNHIYKHQSLSKFSIPTGRKVDAPKAQEATLRAISLFCRSVVSSKQIKVAGMSASWDL